MRLSTKLSGIVAIGGVAALGAGLISSGGIGAAFTDSATANATIKVGDFSCALSSSDPAVTNLYEQSNGTFIAEFNLGAIEQSAASSRTAKLTLTNAGTIPLKATWSVAKTNSNLGSKFTAIPVPAAVLVNQGDTQTADIGFTWGPLGNGDLGHTGTATYTISCDELAGGAVKLQAQGGTATWSNDGSITLTRANNGNPAIELLGLTDFPSSAPSISVDNTSHAPYFWFHFTDGTKIVGYWQANGLAGWGWDVNSNPTSSSLWSGWTNDLNAVNTALSGKTLDGAKLLFTADGGPNGSSVNVTCINVNGNQFVGSDTCAL